MLYERQREGLPSTHYGVNRIFEIGHFSHGDIFMSQWAGDDGEDHDTDKPERHKFNFAHGSEVVLLAAAVGFLRRLGQADRVEVVLTEAEGIIYDEDDVKSRSHIRALRMQSVADGDRCSRFDINELGLSALTVPIPNQPGTIDLVGGTGIYESNSLIDRSLAFVGLPAKGSRERLGERAIFLLPEDVPIMTRMICNMALGEYRDDIKEFLIQQKSRNRDE